MNALSAVKLGAAICAASVMIPATFADSPRSSNLKTAKDVVNSAKYSERDKAADALEICIDTAKDEEASLKDAADDLGGTRRDQLSAIAQVAEARRDALEDSCDALEDATVQEWDVRRRQVSENIDLYAEAMSRLRKAVAEAAKN